MHILFFLFFCWIVGIRGGETFDMQWNDSTLTALYPEHNGLSHSPPRQGWYYKRYRRLSRPNSTVIISTTADSHTLTHTHSVCYFNAQIAGMFFFWSQHVRSSSQSTPPRPFKNRFHSDVHPPGASTHLTVILSVLSSFSRGQGWETSFKICYYSCKYTLSPHHLFLFKKKIIKNRGVCAHVPCRLGHTCQDPYVCVCVWMATESSQAGRLSTTRGFKIKCQ